MNIIEYAIACRAVEVAKIITTKEPQFWRISERHDAELLIPLALNYSPVGDSEVFKFLFAAMRKLRPKLTSWPYEPLSGTPASARAHQPNSRL